MTYFDPPRMQLATHSFAGGGGTFSTPDSCFIAQALSLISPTHVCSAARSATSDSVTTANVIVSQRQSLVIKERIHHSGPPKWNSMSARHARRSVICAKSIFGLGAQVGLTYNYGVSH
jgi:hypothetical protein